MSASTYQPVIGLEIHAELHTKSKMFCSCANAPLERTPNIHICPICMAHPGTLPALNKTAIEHVLKVGTALKSEIADFTEWDRKNYFYPDIPKGYQISQYAYPLVQKGTLTVKNEKGIDVEVGITRIHLEEDTARSSHDKGDFSLVDYNRAGVPLMELVTEPVIHDAKTAGNFGKELQLLLQTLGVSEANMELGQMRVEVNISIHKEGEPWGTKVEIKNLNSFRSAERSIAYEIERQAALLDAGEKVVQETRGFEDATGKTFSQRKKENANDYRYFPDPDLPKLYISKVPEWSHENLLATLPKLPWVRRGEYLAEGMKAEDAEMFISDKFYGDFYEATITSLSKPDLKKLAINYIATDIAGLVKKENERAETLDVYIEKNQFVEIIEMIDAGELSSRGAKDLIALLWKNEELKNKSAKSIAEEKGMIQKNDPEALKLMIQGVIDANPAQVEGFKAGKEPLLMYLVGQVMKEGKGAVNPAKAQEMLREML
ncbi:MAG: Asp-tRNA(Asn)/Glu-tRNA(Gln) amidotransferase subunit GatB [Patescibacteria group bacterium]